MDRKRIVNQKIIDKVHEIRKENPNKPAVWIARYLFVEGYTKRIISESVVRNIYDIETEEEYFNNNNKKNLKTESDPVSEIVSDINNTNVSMMDELKHTNHMIAAMYEEQKNQSRLLKQLIDLWRR